MLTRGEIDPELHTLRSLVHRTDGRERQQLESARFAIYAAFETRDAETARRWCVAMRAGLLAARLDLESGDGEELRAMGLSALETIAAGCADPHEIASRYCVELVTDRVRPADVTTDGAVVSHAEMLRELRAAGYDAEAYADPGSDAARWIVLPGCAGDL